MGNAAGSVTTVDGCWWRGEDEHPGCGGDVILAVVSFSFCAVLFTSPDVRLFRLQVVGVAPHEEYPGSWKYLGLGW